LGGDKEEWWREGVYSTWNTVRNLVQQW
jgi:hypothetical protein